MWVAVMINISNLNVSFNNSKIIRNLNLCVPSNKIVGLTGKSGCGKTTLIKTILGFNRKEVSGSILFNEIELLNLSSKQMKDLLGLNIGYIPQNPMTAFDSRYRINTQVLKILTSRLKKNKVEANKIFISQLESLNFNDCSRVLNSYPNELSGGMLQRIVTSLVLCLSPKLILADEITSALDSNNKEILLKILSNIDCSVIFISHDVESLFSLTDEIYIIEDKGISEVIYTSDDNKSYKSDWGKFLLSSYQEDLGKWIELK